VLGLELVVILGVAVLVCSIIGQRFRIAPPVLLLGSGVALGFLPSLREVQLPSEVQNSIRAPGSTALFREPFMRSTLPGTDLSSKCGFPTECRRLVRRQHHLSVRWPDLLAGRIFPEGFSLEDLIRHCSGKDRR
jgi:hypothetical protein